MTKYNKYGFREDFNPKNRILKQDNLIINGDKYLISTIDFGINMSFVNEIELFYETMIFLNNEEPVYQRRYTLKEEALKNHDSIVDNLKCLYTYEKEVK